MGKWWKKKQFWGGLVGIGLLAYCVKDIRLSELQAMFSRLNLIYLVLATLSSFAFVIIRGIRWKLIVSPQKTIPIVRALTLFSAGQLLNSAMPALTGQVGRLILFSRKESLRKTFVFGTMVLEVLFDAISLVVFVFLASLVFPFPSQYRFIGFIISGATVLMMIALYLILHFQSRLEETGRKRLRSRWPGVYITLKKFIRSFTKGIELLRSSQHLFGSVTYSLAAWTVHILAIYFLFKAFDLEVPFAGAAVVMIINTIVLMVPITPGNAGTFEVAVSTSVAAFAVGRSDAVLFALALHMLDLLPMFVLGLSFIHVERVTLRDIRRRHEHDIILQRISEEGTYIDEEAV